MERDATLEGPDETPWMRRDVFQPVAGSRRERHGYAEAGEDRMQLRPVADAAALARAIESRKEMPKLAWAPGMPFLTTVYELDEISAAVEARSDIDARKRVRRAWPRALLVVALAILGVLFWPEERSVQALILLGSILLFGPLWTNGLVALVDGWLDRRALARTPTAWRTRKAEELRFEAWSTAGTSVVGLGLAITAVALFVTSLVAGRSDAFDALALVKPRVREGEWWRLYTATLLHGGLLHVYFNIMVGQALADQASSLVDEARVLLTFLVSAIAGSVASVLLSDATSVGASGGILGWGGMLAGFATTNPRVRNTGLLGDMLRWVVLLGLFGLVGTGMIDNAAHAGGFAAGYLLGAWFGRTSRGRELPLGGNGYGHGFWLLTVAALGGALAMLVVLVRMLAA